MPIVGAYLGGPEPEVAAGSTGVSLCVNTRDRQNLSTASFRITNAGYDRTFPADATGRSFAIVPSTDVPYQVDLIHEGEYMNDEPQRFIARSGEHVGVYFDLYTYSESNTILKVITKPSISVTITSGTNVLTQVADSGGIVVFNGLPVDSTWTVEANGESETVTIHTIYSEVKIGLTPIYGIRIRISESDPEAACEYTDDAVGITPASGHNLNGWKGTALFEEIKPVVLTSGPKKTYLNLTDLSKTIAGAASNLASVGNDAMTEFPTWYTYLNNDGEYVTIKYCKKQKSGYYAYAHMQSGVLQSHFYVGCFLAYNSSSKLYSMSGVTPTGNVSLTDFIAYAKARGTGYDIFTWFQCMYVVGLVLLAYKTRNLQAHLRGYVDGSSVQSNTASTFDNEYGIAGSTSGTVMMAFLWIWDLWGNMNQFLGRAKTSSACKLMVINDGYSSVTESDFDETISTTISTGKGGYISQVEGGPKSWFFPKAFHGASTIFWCDNSSVDPSYFPHFGGAYGSGDAAGPFRVSFYNFASYASSKFGSRLSYCLGISEVAS